MIVFDTNVVSELMRDLPARQVATMVRGMRSEERHTTSITEAEILRGLMIGPPGRKLDLVRDKFRRLWGEIFADRVLPFDSAAAKTLAKIAAERQSLGRPISFQDAQIAAIVRVHRATLVTRNTSDFEGCGIELVNPWG